MDGDIWEMCETWFSDREDARWRRGCEIQAPVSGRGGLAVGSEEAEGFGYEGGKKKSGP